MPKLISRITVILGLLLLGVPAVQAQFNYTINLGGTSATIVSYNGPPWAVSIPTNINGLTITSIGQDAFDDCTNLTSVTIPGSISSIGEYAFAYCSELKNATIANGVNTIGTQAFQQCTNLTSVTIPGSVTNIGEYTFLACGLTNVTIADGVSTIGEGMFAGCYSLNNVTLPNTVTNIADEAFDYCYSLNKVTIPNGVTSVGENAFYECFGLTNLTISGSVSNIGEYAFEGCTSLTTVTIPGSVTNIARWAFADCTGLTEVFFTGNAPKADSTVFRNYNTYYETNYYSATAYYLPGTTGWGDFSGSTSLGVVLWNPGIRTGDGSFGVQTNQFGFNITNTANLSVVVEVCTNLANPVWLPLRTVTLTNGLSYFSEPMQTNVVGRYYRIGSQ